MTKSRMKPVLDPRGYQERPLLQLAPRVSMDDLRKGPILLYDNIKLDFANYREIYTRIKRNFSEEGINNFVEFRETVRGKTDQDLKDYARSLAAAKPVAAILALGDMGTSPATAILAMLPPVAVVVFMQKLFIKGLVDQIIGVSLGSGAAHYRNNLHFMPPLTVKHRRRIQFHI